MITLLPQFDKNNHFFFPFKAFLFSLFGLLVFAPAAWAEEIRTFLPAQTMVCPGTTSISLEAAAEHPVHNLVVQWQVLQHNTWTNTTGAGITTTFTVVNNRHVTTTRLQITDYNHAQQYRVAFGVNNVNLQNAHVVTTTTLFIPAATFTLPQTDVYANQTAALTFAGEATPNATYNWSFIPAASFVSGTNAQSKNPQVTWSTPGEKKITLTVQDGTCAVTTSQVIRVYGDYTWAGGVSSDWFNAANWLANAVPGAQDNVIIGAAPFLPELNTNTSIRNLTVQSGSLNLGTATLHIGGDAALNGGPVNGGTLILSGNLEVNNPTVTTINQAIFTGSTSQTIQNNSLAGLAFNHLSINKTSNRVALGTSITVNSVLDLNNAPNLQLNEVDLIIAAAGKIIAGPQGYVVTNGTGTLQMAVANDNNEVFFPVGNHSYNPIKIKQSTAGTTDVFKVRVQGGLYDLYGTDNRGVEPPVEDGISRTWVIEEAVKGGSDAQVTLQFSAGNANNDWTPDFSLSKAVFAQYTSSWFTAATGKAMPVINNSQMLQISQSNITSFRLFGIFNHDHQGLNTLPVELLRFKAARVNGQVEVKWSTASEINNDYFNLEQSPDGKNFSSIAQVKGAGNSTRQLDYRYLHQNPSARITYYRLKQTDFDGTFSYSGIIAVNALEGRVAVSAYPNPSTGTFKLTGADSAAKVLVLDATGREVKKLTPLATDYSVDLSGQKAGIYFLHLYAGNEVKTLRLVKDK